MKSGNAAATAERTIVFAANAEAAYILAQKLVFELENCATKDLQIGIDEVALQNDDIKKIVLAKGQ